MRAKDPSKTKWTPVKFDADAKVSVGEPLLSIGLMPKSAGYKPYLATARVSDAALQPWVSQPADARTGIRAPPEPS